MQIHLLTHFADTGRNPSYYDAIISGDLGKIGKEIAIDIAMSKGYNIKSNYNDCGLMIFDTKAQDTHAGGSGCACCGSVFSGFLFKQLKKKKIKKLLLIATCFNEFYKFSTRRKHPWNCTCC